MRKIFIIFLITPLIVALFNGCQTAQAPVQNTVSFGKNYIENFGAKGDGKTDDTGAFEKAIANIPDIVPTNPNTQTSLPGVSKAGEIVLDGTKTYRITRPLFIPGSKNVTFRSDAIGGATIQYEGTGTYVLDFAQRGHRASLAVLGINFVNAGIRLMGAMRGRILINYNQFMQTKGPAIQIMDIRDISKEKKGDNKTFGVCHWLFEYNEFLYCQEGIRAESFGIQLGTIRKCRFFATMSYPLYINSPAILIENCEFLGVKDLTKPYIFLSNKTHPCGDITVSKNRFGSETIPVWNGINFAPPTNYVEIASEGSERSTNILFETNYFFNKPFDGNNQSGVSAIVINNDAIGINVLDGNIFRGFKGNVVSNLKECRHCSWRTNRVMSAKETFQKGKQSWDVDVTADPEPEVQEKLKRMGKPPVEGEEEDGN